MSSTKVTEASFYHCFVYLRQLGEERHGVLQQPSNPIQHLPDLKDLHGTWFVFYQSAVSIPCLCDVVWNKECRILNS